MRHSNPQVAWSGRRPLLFRLKADINQWRWGLRFLYECPPSRAGTTAAAMRLADTAGVRCR